MPNEKNVYLILTDELNKALNNKRQNKGLMKIENTLIARKLGILFAFKAGKHINFNAEHVELNEGQLLDLQEIIDQYFNVDMTDDIHVLAIKPEDMPKNMATNKLGSPTTNKSFINKVKGFFKERVQETRI